MTTEPTETSGIVATIDRALSDWSVGPDGMRWTSDPQPDLLPQRYSASPATIVTVHIDLAPVRRELQTLARRLAAIFDRYNRQLAEATHRMAKLQQQVETARRAQMHTAYRQRQLARRRRNRRRR